MNDDTAELIPVAGIGDWFKNQLKGVLLRYLAPYWNELKAAIQARDFGKLAEIIERAGTLAGYAEIAKAVADVFRAVQAGDWLTVAKNVLALVEMILPYFQKANVSEAEVIRLMTATGTMTTAEGEIVAFVDAVFPDTTVVTKAGDEPSIGPDGKPVGFGFMEIAAIASIIWTAIQMGAAWRKKRKEDKEEKEQKPPLVG